MATASVPQDDCIVYILRRSDAPDPYAPEKPAPFYVGKGKSTRPYMHSWEARNTTRNTHKLNIIRSVERKGGTITAEIVATEMPALIAGIIEQQLIEFYGRAHEGGLLANQTKGGEGVAALPQETIERIRRARIGQKRSPETIAKLRLARVGFKHRESTKILLGNLGRGRKHTPEARAKMSVSIQAAIKRGRRNPVLTPESLAHKRMLLTGRTYPEMANHNRSGGNPAARGLWVDDVLYPTVKDAAQALGVDKTTIYRHIQQGNPRYRYEAGTEAIGAKLSGKESPAARAITVDGVTYATVEEAIGALGIGKTTLYRWIRKGHHAITYVEPFDSMRQTAKRPVSVNGVPYPSIGAAILALGIGETTFYRHVKEGKYVIEDIEL